MEVVLILLCLVSKILELDIFEHFGFRNVFHEKFICLICYIKYDILMELVLVNLGFGGGMGLR